MRFSSNTGAGGSTSLAETSSIKGARFDRLSGGSTDGVEEDGTKVWATTCEAKGESPAKGTVAALPAKGGVEALEAEVAMAALEAKRLPDLMLAEALDGGALGVERIACAEE